MTRVEVEEVGGIRTAKRAIPSTLLVIAVAVLSIAAWYVLSFSSTDYHGSYPRPEAPAGAPASHE